jgi:hypothetical protein
LACDDALGFFNPNKTVILLLRDELPHAQLVQVQVSKRVFAVELRPDSIATLRRNQRSDPRPD